jgi:hypothetical protein
MTRFFVRSMCSFAVTVGIVVFTCGSVLAQDVKYNYAMGRRSGSC